MHLCKYLSIIYFRRQPSSITKLDGAHGPKEVVDLLELALEPVGPAGHVSTGDTGPAGPAGVGSPGLRDLLDLKGLLVHKETRTLMRLDHMEKVKPRVYLLPAL